MYEYLVRLLTYSTKRTAESTYIIFIGKGLLDSVFLTDFPSEWRMDATGKGRNRDAQYKVHHVGWTI